jgi:transcriptional regulator with GAF, ATPase, and Fis domain
MAQACATWAATPKAADPSVQVILVSAHSSLETTVEGLRAGRPDRALARDAGGLQAGGARLQCVLRAPSPDSAGTTPAFAGLPTLDELERRYLAHVLEAAGGNRTRAARILGIDRRTLYRMAARFGIPLCGGESEEETGA